MNKARRSHQSNSSSATRIGKLKLRQIRLARQRTIRIWISCIVVLFLGLHQLAMLHASPGNSLDSSPSDLLYGGFSSKEELLLTLDDSKNNSYPKNLLRALNISATDIKEGSLEPTWQSYVQSDQSRPLVIWSRSANYQPPFLSQGALLQPKFAVASDTSIYYGSPIDSAFVKPLSLSPALTGKDLFGEYFHILASTGNVITTWDTAQTATLCYKTPDRSLSYLNCPNSNDFKSSISAINKSYNIDAQYLKAKTGDYLEYTLTTENHGNEVVRFHPLVSVDDLLEYTTLETFSGATFNSKYATLTWPSQTLSPNQKQTFRFTVRVRDTVPSRHQNSNNARSYDCRLTTYYGSLYSVDITCPPQKVIERLLTAPNHSNFVLYSAWFILIVNSLLILHISASIRRTQIDINELRRSIAP